MIVQGLPLGLVPSALLVLVAVVPCPALRPSSRVGVHFPVEPLRAQRDGRVLLRDPIPNCIGGPLSFRLRGGHSLPSSSTSTASTNNTDTQSADAKLSHRLFPVYADADRTSPSPDWSDDEDFEYAESQGISNTSIDSKGIPNNSIDRTPTPRLSSELTTASSWVTDFSSQPGEHSLQWGYSAVPPADLRPGDPVQVLGGSAPVEYVVTPPAWLMDKLKRLFTERHGRSPSEDDVREWANALVDARRKQELALVGGQAEDVTVHIAGVLVDMKTGKVAVVKKKRRIGRSDHYSPPHMSKSKCFKEGCLKRGSFLNPNPTDEHQYVACRDHAPQSFVSETVLRGHVTKSRKNGERRTRRRKNDYSSMKCAYEGCTVTPSYGDVYTAKSAGGTVMFCKQHKLSHHVNVRQPLCQHSTGCKHGALYGKADDRKKVRCFQHMLPGDVNLGANLCQYAGGCSKRAVFGRRTVGKPRHCSTHKMDDEIDLVHKLCDFKEGDVLCQRQAGYGQPGEGPRKCRIHKGPGYVSMRRRHFGGEKLNPHRTDAHHAAHCQCICSTTPTPAPPLPIPPPTEIFNFCMSTPWWSPSGPSPISYSQQGWHMSFSQQGYEAGFDASPALPSFPVVEEGRVPSSEHVGVCTAVSWTETDG